ncbi:MAG: FecR domain-containing protein, partial [Planctomycetes bacterium]|nr:FecR domain-containing protein [Planctomycetota bacterium]
MKDIMVNQVRVLAFALLLITLCSAEESKIFGKALSIEGTVTCYRSLLKKEIAEGEELMFNDRIETDGDSSVEIALTDGSSLLLSPSSKLRLIREKNKTDLELDVGALRCEVQPVAEQAGFYVHTPVAVVGVRGTDFVVEYAADEGAEEPFEVSVLNGEVEVESLLEKRAEFRKKLVQKSESMRLDRRGGFMALQKLKQDRIETLKKRLSMGEARRQKIKERAGEFMKKLRDKKEGI